MRRANNARDTLPNATRLGEVSHFYLPVAKLEMVIGKPPRVVRQVLHDFFLSRFGAYTHESSRIVGFWRACPASPLSTDDNERFEVAIADPAGVEDLASFLSSLCGELQEQAIYLTVAGVGWLIRPQDVPENR